MELSSASSMPCDIYFNFFFFHKEIYRNHLCLKDAKIKGSNKICPAAFFGLRTLDSYDLQSSTYKSIKKLNCQQARVSLSLNWSAIYQ